MHEKRAIGRLIGLVVALLVALSGAAVAQEGTGTGTGVPASGEGTGSASEGTGAAAPEAAPPGAGEQAEALVDAATDRAEAADSGHAAAEHLQHESTEAAGQHAGHELIEEAGVVPSGEAPVIVSVVDAPNDSGEALDLIWTLPSDATQFAIFASSTPPEAAEWTHLMDMPAQIQSPLRVAGESFETGSEYWLRMEAVFADGSRATSEAYGPVVPEAQWFDSGKTWIAILGAVLCFFVIFFIETARRGRKLFIRKIAGLEAIDEAIGRSTEMGRPILFVPGIMDMDNVQTLAGLTILGHVSKMVADYETEINVPVSRSLVMTAGREVIQQAFLEAGRPDAYNDKMVHFLTDEQFGYVAGVNGIIVRDEPACCFYQGAFYAESLILAETGNGIGAIQIAGTAMPSQLPFFVAACDYTLIGEELFAASAYLSDDPQQLGSLKGQDMGKIIAMVAIVLGAVAATVVQFAGTEGGLGGALSSFVAFLHDVFGAS